jgi:hypothetical protein
MPRQGSIEEVSMSTLKRSLPHLFLLLLLTAGAPARAATTTINVTNQGMTAWLFNGASPNGTLSLVRGQTYAFVVSATGHPFHITTAEGLPPQDFSDTGLTGNGTASGTIMFTVPATSQNPIFYQCGVHAAMTGQINLTAAPPPVPAVGPFTLALLVLSSLGAGFFLLRRRIRA